jgi:hypothetical protein
MDYSYQGRHPPTQLAAMVAQRNVVVEDQQWLADSGANTHITNELENLTLQQPFQSDETVTVGNGASLAIENSGPPSCSLLILNFILKMSFIVLRLLPIYYLFKNFALIMIVILS